MVQLKFFDLRTKKPFVTDKFKIEVLNGRTRAVTVSPSGSKSVRFVKKDFKK